MHGYIVTIGRHRAGHRYFRDIDVQYIMISNSPERPGTSIGEAVLELEVEDTTLDLAVPGSFWRMTVQRTTTERLEAELIPRTLAPNADVNKEVVLFRELTYRAELPDERFCGVNCAQQSDKKECY